MGASPGFLQGHAGVELPLPGHSSVTTMWIVQDLSIAASLAVKWESLLLITCLVEN